MWEWCWLMVGGWDFVVGVVLWYGEFCCVVDVVEFMLWVDVVAVVLWDFLCG